MGDLKYFAQLMGRENMRSSRCMWCTAHPSTWKQHHVADADNWTIEKIKSVKERIDRKELKEPQQMLRVVNDLSGTLWNHKTTFFQSYMLRLA
jgi:hypothetical protein